MTTVSRASFVREFASGIDVGELTEGTRTALARAGVGGHQLAALAGRDGIIGTPAELKQLFALIDRVDRDGSYGSIDTGRRDGADKRKAASTPSGAAYQALKKELEDRRTAARLSGSGEVRPDATDAGRPPRFSVKPDDPQWLRIAGGEVGIEEMRAVGKAHPRIVEYFEATWDKRQEDSGRDNAWCGAFVTWTLTEAGIKNSGAVGARGYETFGEPCEPFRGAIAVLQSGKQKHVAFVAGVDENGAMVFLGGNQDNQVSAVTLSKYDVIAIRKPAGFEVPESLKRLPMLDVAKGKDTR